MSKIIRTAVIPGSFDPITTGHLDIIERAAAMFDFVYVTAFSNADKKGSMFSSDEKLHMLRLATAHLDNVVCSIESGLTAVFARERDAVIVKGIRNGTDLDYEMTMYGINRAVEGVDTIFIPAKQEYMHISSTFVREMLRYEHDFTGLVPPAVHKYLCEEWMK
ncbi:MAG: pantetheine-phosphate adenylyltransferase [Ruminococcaceae bacterium]|nr:pantetheine-phosphate adenylyltransferase [Oscillospiraceae bacterium]